MRKKNSPELGGPCWFSCTQCLAAPRGHGWFRGSRLSLVLGLGCPQFLVLWVQALGRDPLVADLELRVAAEARQAQCTNYAANRMVGQGERGTKLSGTGYHRRWPGAWGLSG